MFTRKMLIFWLVFVLIGLVAITLLFNFQIARSATRVEHQISTSSFGFDSGESLSDNAPLTLVVEGPDQLSKAIAIRLEHQFLEGPITRVTRANIVQSDIRQFQVVVSVADPAVIWSPFYAQTQLAVNFKFSSNGDFSWRDKDSIVFSSDQGQMVAVSGDLQLSDTTYGLISRPAYLNHLADEIASQIDEAIRKALASPTNPALPIDP